MSGILAFSHEDREALKMLCRRLRGEAQEKITLSDYRFLKSCIDKAIAEEKITRDRFGLNPIILDLKTAYLVTGEIGHRRDIIISIVLNRCMQAGVVDIKDVDNRFGKNVSNILTSLAKINSLYAKSPTVESENFRNLLLSFADDMRFILIMIADRLVLMRHIAESDNNEARLQVANEAAKLYAPLAHKLGFYKMKSELEDLVVKYTEPEVYAELSRKLEETAASREDYMKNFIHPIEKALKSNPHIKYRIKGRTKSIHSIWQKMKRQKCSFEGIYDIFAIRIIIDSEPANEKSECWQVYSLVTDMYTPNPHRLRDWLSVPKSNGYESLHTTVMGPEGRWVEVQIRT
ncbi:MAG: bifunctional (p)ppGpp synthetase/guanosine-3',5'-bis(diphosphate) 3'-pyrophosphohydrolase, partial [Bacteroidaceae bacterium]|nr:bifunctional (p)ppGpp synthetase/guanosine-3',5'-bis(diphosphate) 3'-pyrophosphohydrolase [Bacteroidaceae bacterium]